MVELLVVTGVIAVLIAVLLPALSLARASAQRAQCASNLRQLVVGSTVYANESGGYWPPAHLFFYSQNNHRWHGTRANNAAAFGFDFSPLRKQLGSAGVKQCPSFAFVEGAAGFERSNGGYGYNNVYLGSSIGMREFVGVSLPLAEMERRVVNVPAKAARVRNPAAKIAFADAAIGNPSLIEYSFVTAPRDGDGNETSPSMHFRHRKHANVAWADGHASAERFGWTYPRNVYGARNAELMIGFFGPRDNALFARD